MAEILSETADRASPASAFLYGATETDIQERNAANRGALLMTLAWLQT